MKYSEAGHGLMAYENPWERSLQPSGGRGNAERGSPGDEPGGVSHQGKALKGVKPQERQRHETGPQGLAKIKPSRV